MDSPCELESDLKANAADCFIVLSCALIHCHRPELLDYNKLDKVKHKRSGFRAKAEYEG